MGKYKTHDPDPPCPSKLTVIALVPTANDLFDVALSNSQRNAPRYELKSFIASLD